MGLACATFGAHAYEKESTPIDPLREYVNMIETLVAKVRFETSSIPMPRKGAELKEDAAVRAGRAAGPEDIGAVSMDAGTGRPYPALTRR